MANSEETKLYYSIGEVSEMTGVETHVLRYWESEFPTFRPRKSRTGQRAYTRKDIDMALNIKKLLYEDKFTIKGAKTKLKDSLPVKVDSPAKSGGYPDKTTSLKTEPEEKQKESLSLFSDAVETKKKNLNQLVFGAIEQHAETQLCDKEFLTAMRSKLVKISNAIKKMVI